MNLSYSMQRDQVCLPRAPNINQSSDEPKVPVKSAREGEDDTKFTSTQSFPAFHLDTFCPSARLKSRSENQTAADAVTGSFSILLLCQQSSSGSPPHCGYQRRRKYSITGKIAMYIVDMSCCRGLEITKTLFYVCVNI